MAVYKVTGPDGKETLVESRLKQSAINHVASTGYTAEALSMSDVVKYAKEGREIQIVKTEEKPKVAGPAPIIDEIEKAKADEAKAATKDEEAQKPSVSETANKKSLFQKKSA